MTLRPGQRLLGHEKACIKRVAQRGGIVLLTDDPPKSGSSLARTARAIEKAGVPRPSIKLLLPLLANVKDLPLSLSGYETLVLPWERWTVQDSLHPDRLQATLRELLRAKAITVSEAGDYRSIEVADVDHVELIDMGPRADLKAGSPVRRHVQCLLRVTLRDVTGRRLEHYVYVKGVGLGYMGHHSIAVAQRLARFFPEMYGVSDGLMFRAWQPEARRLGSDSPPVELAQTMADYVAARGRALPAAEDKSLRTAGLNPIWQRVADFLGQGFGRQRAMFRPALHAAAQTLLLVDKPSVIDGSMSLSQWFSQPAGTQHRFVKVDYDERAFSNQDTVIDQLYSYDPIFDLAVAASDHELEVDPQRAADGFGERLVQSYELASATATPPERWFLYQILNLSSHQHFLESLLHEIEVGAIPRDGLESLSPAAVRAVADRSSRAAARIDQRYLARTLLADVTSPVAGRLCAIDIDGVLETGWLRHSSATPTGVLSLRRLMRHGYRPILVTGRSLGDVMDRCHHFGLAGGVAEYGSVVYDHRANRVVELMQGTERTDLERIRTRLSSIPGIHVDGAYRRTVRASLVTEYSRQPLPQVLIDDLISELNIATAVRTVHGLAQTDVIPAGSNKGHGVRALAKLLTADTPNSEPALAFAIGDSVSDLTMLGEASARFGPANSDQAVRTSGARVMTRPRQQGLAQAISLFLGHKPHRCPICRGPEVSRDASLLMTATSAGGAGRWTKLQAGLRLALLLAG
jgi:hydroxymethylpyrimidine pyrophosphatase-like HAD family hydrolase